MTERANVPVKLTKPNAQIRLFVRYQQQHRPIYTYKSSRKRKTLINSVVNSTVRNNETEVYLSRCTIL